MSLLEDAPAWGLALAYWLHMLATVFWIGGLAALVLLVLPTAHQSMPFEQYAKFMDRLQKRLDPLAWFCLAVLLATGMFQMSANPNYAGLLAINNPWAVSILLKHILFLGMIVLASYQTWWLMPALRRALLRSANPSQPIHASTEIMQKRIVWLSRINLILAVLILLATAFARVA